MVAKGGLPQNSNRVSGINWSSI